MALMAVLCLSSLFFISQLFANGTWNNRETMERAPISIDRKSGDTDFAIEVRDGVGEKGTRRFRLDYNGNMSFYDTGGVTHYSILSDSIIIIDTLAELSTYNGAGAGSSYFQMESGKTYLVDFEAIRTDDKTALTGVTSSSWSAVSAMLPLADTSSHYNTVTVGIICSGGTGYAPAMAGVTTVQVWPALLAGGTRFGEPSVGNQNMMYHGTSSTPFFVGSSTNTYDQGINYLNESVTWRFLNSSAVSAQIVERTLSQ